MTDAIYDAGYSAPSRFYAETEGRMGMAPTAWKDGGRGVTIHWAVVETSLGRRLVAATVKGVCRLSFDEGSEALAVRFPKAELIEGGAEFAGLLDAVIASVEVPGDFAHIPLDVQGTAFQEAVWRELRRIPPGETRSYAQIAAAVGKPNAVRATGSANGANNVAVLIPCHRVVRSDGSLGGYAYGLDIKRELLARGEQVMDNVERFRALHVAGDPLVLFNVWDAGSAQAVAAAGASAIATGSYGVACARGSSDGENLSLDAALANLAEILSVTDLPVSIDMEAGYGATPAEVGVSVARARELGAAGINMEDRLPGSDALLSITVAAARIAAAAATGLFVNARCDTFRGRDAAADGPALVAETLERARAYAGAGAGGLFVPSWAEPGCIAAICAGLAIAGQHPVVTPCGDRAALAVLGVARISHGHQPWAAAMDWLKGQAAAVLQGGVPPYAT